MDNNYLHFSSGLPKDNYFFSKKENHENFTIDRLISKHFEISFLKLEDFLQQLGVPSINIKNILNQLSYLKEENPIINRISILEDNNSVYCKVDNIKYITSYNPKTRIEIGFECYKDFVWNY